MASPMGALSEELLEEIVIRLPSLADVGRASCTCSAFHRVVKSSSFLRRLRAAHPPILLGLRSCYGGFQPVEQPGSSAAAGRAVAGAADFRLGFLPNPGLWVVRDALCGRFVVDLDERKDGTFTKIAVCDPLHHRSVVLPPTPDDLAAVVEEEPVITSGYCSRRCEVFLVPCGEEGPPPPPAAVAAEETLPPFKIIWMAQCPRKLVAFLFTSASGQWGAISAHRWKELNPAMPSVANNNQPPMLWRSSAHGSFYWFLNSAYRCSSLVRLNTGSIEFSTESCPQSPPPGRRDDSLTVVELGEGRCGIFRFTRHGTKMKLFCENPGTEGASEWVLRNKVSLPPSQHTRMLGVAEGKLILQTRRDESRHQPESFGCISVDIKTLQVQSVRGGIRGGSGARPLPFLYTGYPPSLSS